jgi:hypothetical protein
MGDNAIADDFSVNTRLIETTVSPLEVTFTAQQPLTTTQLFIADGAAVLPSTAGEWIWNSIIQFNKLVADFNEIKASYSE